jgi:hypothetical protein
MDSWFFLPFPRAVLDLWNRGSGRGEEPGGAKGSRLIQIRFSDAEFAKNLANPSSQFAASANRGFQFDARQQSRLFARWNQSLRRSPNSHPALLRLSAMISRYFMLCQA